MNEETPSCLRRIDKICHARISHCVVCSIVLVLVPQRNTSPSFLPPSHPLPPFPWFLVILLFVCLYVSTYLFFLPFVVTVEKHITTIESALPSFPLVYFSLSLFVSLPMVVRKNTLLRHSLALTTSKKYNLQNHCKQLPMPWGRHHTHPCLLAISLA